MKTFKAKALAYYWESKFSAGISTIAIGSIARNKSDSQKRDLYDDASKTLFKGGGT